MIVERSELERNAVKLRQVANDLRDVAPMLSLRAAALARDAELKIEALEYRERQR